MNNLYILKTISITEKTKLDLQKEWKARNVIYDNYVGYEKYIILLKTLNMDKYVYEEENNCYFIDMENARDCAENNIADINDGGLYNYIAIIEIPFDQTYAATEIQSLHIFKFNDVTNGYDEVVLNNAFVKIEDEVQYIISQNKVYK